LIFKTTKTPIWAEKNEHDQFFTELTGLSVSDYNKSPIRFRIKQVILFTILGIFFWAILLNLFRKFNR
jgi:hypothetical protein